jgi:ZIP family zinc transporter
VAVAITMHNIPEGIAVAMPIYFATGSKKEALKYSFYTGAAEPLGALLAFLVLRLFINEFLLGAIFTDSLQQCTALCFLL